MLYGEPFLTKPPGHYAAIGLCSLPFGEVTAASARLPSVFAAALAVVLMHGMFRRTLGGKAAAMVAVLLPCSVLWLDKVPSAEIDMTLVGWVTAAIVLFHRALESENATRYWVGALLCVASGTLTKWTAPAFFYLTVIPLLAWRRQLLLLFGWRHLLAVSIAVGACALWAMAVVQQVGYDALAETIRKEAAYRFAPKASKGYPWGDLALYPLAVFAAHLPVSAFALLTFRKSFWAKWDARGKLLLQLLHCWTWPNLLFWTLVPNHNVRYALPMSAGLMGLGVMGLLGWKKPLPPTPSPKKGGGVREEAIASPSESPSPLGGGVGEGSALEEPLPPTPSPKKGGGAREEAIASSVLSPSPLRGGAGEGSVLAEPLPPTPSPKKGGGAREEAIASSVLSPSPLRGGVGEGSALAEPLPPAPSPKKGGGVREEAIASPSESPSPLRGGVGEGSALAEPLPPTPSPQKGGGAREGEDAKASSVLSPSPLRGGVGEGFLLLFLLIWIVAKIAFVEFVIPNRTAGRNAEVTAAELRAHVPDGQPLYLFKLKDEGVTFYYARPAVRAHDPQSLPPGTFSVLIRQEWEDRAAFGQFALVCCMHDQQGDPIYLVHRVGHSLRE